MKKYIKHIIFFLIMAIMTLPGLQSIFPVIPEAPLHGDFITKDEPRLNRSGWMAGSYQDSLVPWLEENIGFRNLLVRVHNQYDYSLFKIIHAEGVIRGRNGQLYEEDYIRAWEGKDFIGEALLDKKIRQLRFLQQHLKDSLDIELVLILEPGKASVYPEDIPAGHAKAPAGEGNYEYIASRATELGVNLIDLNAWFLRIKDTSSYPLYPVQGTHWSEFAMWYAADSMANYIEKKLGIDLPDLILEGTDYSRDLRSTDYDVGTTLNLLWELDHPAMPYPRYRFAKTDRHVKPMVLAVADSYYWNIYNAGIPENIFANRDFWYFYNHVYPEYWEDDLTVEDLDIRREIEKQDVIFLMMTERFLYKFDRGFVDDLFAIYGMPSVLDRITQYKTKILNLDSWFNRLLAASDSAGMSMGEMMDREAWFLLWSEDPETYYSIKGWEPLIADIREDSAWFAGVKQRANDNGQEVEERLKIEAEYVLGQRYPEALKKFKDIKEIKSSIKADSILYNALIKTSMHYFMTVEEMLQAEAESIYRK